MAELERVAWMWIDRLDALAAEADRLTERMRKLDPDAAQVLIPLREQAVCSRELGRIMGQICKEMGQDPSTVDRIAHNWNVQAKQQLLGLLPSTRLKAERRHLAEGNPNLSGHRLKTPVSWDEKELVTDRRTGRMQHEWKSKTLEQVIAGIQSSEHLTVAEIQAQVAEVKAWYANDVAQAAVEQAAQQVFDTRYRELMAEHGVTVEQDREAQNQGFDAYLEGKDQPEPVDESMLHPDDRAAAVRQAETEFARMHLNTPPVPEPVEEPDMELYRIRSSASEPASKPVEETVTVEETVEPEPTSEPATDRIPLVEEWVLTR
jgi:hypothetical protein